MIFATFWMFFVTFATFFPKINDFSGIYLSFLAIRSRETGGRSRETGVRSQEAGGRRQETGDYFYLFFRHPTPSFKSVGLLIRDFSIMGTTCRRNPSACKTLRTVANSPITPIRQRFIETLPSQTRLTSNMSHPLRTSNIA